jgi:hypothetical protein
MASILDAVFGAFMLLVFGIVVLISLFVFNSISTTGLFGSYTSAFNQFYTSINNVAIFIAIGMSLAAVFAGLMIKTHPVFFIIAIVLVFVEFMVVPQFVQVYNGVAQSMPAAVQNSMAQQSQIFQMLPILTAIGTMLTVIVGLVRE